MEVFASYYGSVLLDPSRGKELGPLLRFLRQTAQSLDESDSLQVVEFEEPTGKFRIDMEGVLESQTHKKVVAVLQALGRFAKGVGSFTVEHDDRSYTIWIGTEHDVRRTKVGIYLQAALQLLKKARDLSDSPKEVQQIIEDLEALEETQHGKDFNLLPPL
ncbi:hypothetical protein SAMN02746041_00135 [Desulfacinum hydrothermale DSM 13146]|uniref:Uncharacterized protein n=1 Tax=Desulfacinum hydrothermale DSM 13146 TaxID=1121390 RepID=A0A1W1WYH4_9BACT|nr:hypothetical protein [Desulfacinum hydrothermale]SMC16667.1 hypothetical protein SAMN02746041_00135 [Desulfacinum hydrothermale DSM 13146]